MNILKTGLIATSLLSVSLFAQSNCEDCSAKEVKKAECGVKCAVTSTVKKSKEISTAALKKGLSGFTLIDARAGSKYDDNKRIPGAQGLSLKATNTQITAALTDKNAKIVTYCGSLRCPMSKMMATKLRKLGYKNVQEYSHGIAGWKKAGNKVEKVK